MGRARHIILLFLIFIVAIRSEACFILFLSDGKQVLVANHEDWFAGDAGIRINAPSPGHYGSAIFTFLSEGWAQGGMNEKGLFFDAAHTPFQEVRFGTSTRPYPGFLWQAVLDNCANVEEAIQFIMQYELPELQEVDVMLADATGHSVILGIHNGKVDTKPFVQTYLMQTNFNPWHPELSEEPRCWRYEKAQQQLSVNAVASIENMKSILEQTHQDSLTVYSNIYDLKNKIIYTYNKRNFRHAVVTRLSDTFSMGDWMGSLDSLETDSLYWKKPMARKPVSITLSGKVMDHQTGRPIPYVNIGLFGKNVGTLSDPDGTFELKLPLRSVGDSVIFSSIGFQTKKIRVSQSGRTSMTIALEPSSTVLNEVLITAKKKTQKAARLGWMGGRDGVLPLDTVQGGGAIALLVKTPSIPFQVDKLQVRLMYNSKDTIRLRLHFYAYDSVNQVPSAELLSREVILQENKRFGWLRFDLADYAITLTEKYFLVGFEWIEDNQTRKSMLEGLRNWEKWKKEQYESGNKNVQPEVVRGADGNEVVRYNYLGNMMNWPGFKDLPPFTGLMVKKGKDAETINLKTFERKTSFGQWREIQSTLNVVVTIAY